MAIGGSGPVSSSTSSRVLATDPDAIVVPSVADPEQASRGRTCSSSRTIGPSSCGRWSSRAPTAPNPIVEKGLKEGETVVTDGQLRLVPGSRISDKTASEGKVAP